MLTSVIFKIQFFQQFFSVPLFSHSIPPLFLVLNVKAVVAAFNQEKALVGAFSVIVQPVVEPMDRFAALVHTAHHQHTGDLVLTCSMRGRLNTGGGFLGRPRLTRWILRWASSSSTPLNSENRRSVLASLTRCSLCICFGNDNQYKLL